MLCDVSVRFNVLGDEVLGSVSDKRSPEDRELLVGFQATEALRRFHHSERGLGNARHPGMLCPAFWLNCRQHTHGPIMK
jgi:hypothetical protein